MHNWTFGHSVQCIQRRIDASPHTNYLFEFLKSEPRTAKVRAKDAQVYAGHLASTSRQSAAGSVEISLGASKGAQYSQRSAPCQTNCQSDVYLRRAQATCGSISPADEPILATGSLPTCRIDIRASRGQFVAVARDFFADRRARPPPRSSGRPPRRSATKLHFLQNGRESFAGRAVDLQDLFDKFSGTIASAENAPRNPSARRARLRRRGSARRFRARARP